MPQKAVLEESREEAKENAGAGKTNRMMGKEPQLAQDQEEAAAAGRVPLGGLQPNTAQRRLRGLAAVKGGAGGLRHVGAMRVAMFRAKHGGPNAASARMRRLPSRRPLRA